MNIQKLRLPLDILMTILSIILMGGTVLFPNDIVHEILGVALFALWAVHIMLNRRWFGAMFRGRYNARRILQTVINCSILVCVIFLIISGIILSNHIFTFLGIESGLGFARTSHLLASHWYFLFMSLHIGLHVEMITRSIQSALRSVSENSEKPHRRASVIPRLILALISLYGLYAFISRGVWRYLFLRQQFFFFDMERGYVLFAIDYIAIIVLFATGSHYLSKLIRISARQKSPSSLA